MKKKIVDSIFEIIKTGTNRGIGQLYTDDYSYSTHTISINNHDKVNFGSYSYLGLEHDIKLKKAAISAIERYGIQFPSSRTYLSSTLYKELEDLFFEIYGVPVVLSTTTTLAHMATMPIVIEEGDVIIMDQQVHSSVQFMIHHMERYGVPFEILRHNNMNQLETKIKTLSNNYKRVWYMIDGVYSMYGDVAPINEIQDLLNKYKKFYLYADDAHGMSWAGKNGRGYVLSQMELHRKMVLVTSLNKAFASGGALTVCKDPKLSDRIKTCGGPLIFAGQHQTSSLGSAIACAKIHLSSEIEFLQKDLNEKIKYCFELIKDTNLPIISNGKTPIFFIGLGLPRVGYNLVEKMINSGFFLNLAIFPAVSETCSGIRFTITTSLSFVQIKEMVSNLEENFNKTLKEEGRSLTDIHRAFRKVKTFAPVDFDSEERNNVPYFLEHKKTIKEFQQEDWDDMMKNKSTFKWNGLLELEKIFSGSKNEKKWGFDYFLIRNDFGKIVFASFTTLTLVKDDILSSPEISYEIENIRLNDPFYMCSKMIMMGNPLSIGPHYYIDEKEDYKSIFNLFLEKLESLRQEYLANSINLRDFPENKTKEVDYILSSGFLKIKMLDSYVIQLNEASNIDAYLKCLNSKQRRFVKLRAIQKEEKFDLSIINENSKVDVELLYQLYLNVSKRSFEINLFNYPRDVISNAIKSQKWDVFILTLKGSKETVGMSCNYINNNTYHFLMVGLDYNYVKSYDVYSQILFQVIKRAFKFNCTTINLGYTTAQNKRKFGALKIETNSLLRVNDKYNMEVIEGLDQRKFVNNYKQSRELTLTKNT